MNHTLFRASLSVLGVSLALWLHRTGLKAHPLFIPLTKVRERLTRTGGR